MARPGNISDAEIEELVSHVLALRKDFIQRLLAEADVDYRGLRKADLRTQAREAIEAGTLTVEGVIEFLDRVEPGGKQHVFLYRPAMAINSEWRDHDRLERSLARRRATKDLLEGSVPLLMPADLELSSIRLLDDGVEVVGVEARRYVERDESYDRSAETEEGLPVELRAYVERIARSTVVLRWNTSTRHAALHITQATGRSLERDHYTQVANRFADAVKPWLPFDEFRSVNLNKVIHTLQKRERNKNTALTRSRRGRWGTVDGSEMEAVSPGAGSSLFADRRMARAIGEVADDDSGQSGNLYWLARDGNPLSADLHLALIAADARVHFMIPSTPEVVDYVIDEIRSLL